MLFLPLRLRLRLGEAVLLRFRLIERRRTGLELFFDLLAMFDFFDYTIMCSLTSTTVSVLFLISTMICTFDNYILYIDKST